MGVIEMRDIGKNIRDLREQAKLTQDALAEQLCTTRQTISNYERGKTRPDVEQIRWIGIAIAECPGAAEACLQRCVVCV